MDKEKIDFTKNNPSEKKSLAEIDELIARRKRGRVIGGEVVPFEQRMRDLENKKKERGVLPPSEEVELDELELKFKGPKLERR